MKTIIFIFFIIFFLFLANSFVFGSFSTHTGTSITRTFNPVTTIIGDSIIISVGFNNSEAHAINGFYYADYIPQGLTVNTVSVKINGQEISDYLFESGIVDEVYLGCIVYRWILETPTNFAEENPISSGASVEIVYSLRSNQEGTFYCDEFHWVGYFKDAPEGQRSTFGHSMDDDKQIISFVNSPEMNLPKGWSMISLPVIPYSAKLSELFPEAVVVYGFKDDFGYVHVTEEEELEVGKGYWILLDQEKSYNILGQLIQKYSLTANRNGWDMIGGCTFSSQYSVDNCSIKVIYRFIQEGYQRVLESENLEAGKGYWILFYDVLDQCELMVKTTGF